MKKTLAIFAIITILLTLFTFTTKVYATQAAIDNGTESKLVQIKETQTKSLQDYQEKYGSEAYGLVAYILNLIRIYSIPFCFLGIAIGAIHQYIIGIRYIRERNGTNSNIRYIISNMPSFTISIRCVCKVWKGVTNESIICCK